MDTLEEADKVLEAFKLIRDMKLVNPHVLRGLAVEVFWEPDGLLNGNIFNLENGYGNACFHGIVDGNNVRSYRKRGMKHNLYGEAIIDWKSPEYSSHIVAGETYTKGFFQRLFGYLSDK